MHTQKYNELTLTASNYNRKTSLELPCDVNMSELVDAFETLVVGLGYSLESWKDEIVVRGEVFNMQELRNQTDMEFYINRITQLENELLLYKMDETTNRLAMEG